MKLPDGHKTNPCVHRVAYSQSRERSTMSLFTVPKVWDPAKAELREGEAIKERMNLGLYWAAVLQPLTRRSHLLRRTAGSTASGRATWTPTDFCCWGQDLRLCQSAGVQSIDDSMLISSPQLFPLLQKLHIWELGLGSGIRSKLLSSWWWYLWGSHHQY